MDAVNAGFTVESIFHNDALILKLPGGSIELFEAPSLLLDGFQEEVFFLLALLNPPLDLYRLLFMHKD